MTNRMQQHVFGAQRGAAVIMTAGFMLLGVLCLALVVDTGRLYMEKRSLQRVADLAAMEVAFRRGCETGEETAFARASTRRNGFEHAGNQSVEAACGRIVFDGSKRTFEDTAATSAVRVTARLLNTPASLIAGGILGRRIDLQAVAVAVQSDPVASFSVGAQLLRVNSAAPLGQVLRAVGVDANRLTVLDSAGLASVKISPSGLLQALGLGLSAGEISALSPEGLANLSAVKLGDILDASIDLIHDNALQAELGLLRNAINLNPTLKDVSIKLGSDANTRGLFALVDSSAGAALDVGVSVADLIKTSLAIGASGRGLAIPNLNVAGLINVQLGIVEPPSIGIGGVGTKAYNAQVRLYVDIDTDKTLGGALRPLLNLLGVRVNLPIFIDVVNGHGTLEAIHCDTDPRTADISVTSDILKVCVGDVPAALRWSTSDVCTQANGATALVKLLSPPLPPAVSGKLSIAALKHQDTLEGMEVGEVRSTSPNNLMLGDTVNDLVDSLLSLLGNGLLKPPASGAGSQSQVATNIASTYLEATKNANGTYNVDNAINLLRNGNSSLQSLGTWSIAGGVPYSCALGLLTCYKDGTVWDSFKATTVPSPSLVGGLLDILVGGTQLKNCSGLLSGGALNYNNCLKDNLAGFLKGKPGGLTESNDVDSIASGGSCTGLLCLLLKPVISLLTPILNGLGGLLSNVLQNVLGLELGRTDVQLRTMECGTGRLVI